MTISRTYPEARRIFRRPAQVAYRQRPFVSQLADVFTALLGLTASFVVHFVGDLPVSEVLMVVAFLPILIVYYRRLQGKGLLPFYLLMAGWLLSQILTDIYRRTATLDWLRGDATIIWFAADFAVVVMLMSGNQLRKLLFIVTFAIGSILAYKIQPYDIALEAPWKFGYAAGANLLAVYVCTLCTNRRRYALGLLVIAGITVVNLVANYRSAVLVLMLTVALAVPVIPEQVGPWRVLPPVGSASRITVLISIALLFGVGTSSLVKMLSSKGYLGDIAQQKNESESKFQGGLLLGGRPEILVSSRAAWDSPILGHGSWAKDLKYGEMLNDLEIEYGMDDTGDAESIDESSAGLIPTHSHLMNAWVWAGLLGAVFWLYVLWLVTKASFQLSMFRPPYSPLYIFLGVNVIWDVMFSPFGTWRRLVESVVIVIMTDVIRDREGVTSLTQRLRPRKWRRRQFNNPPQAAARQSL